MNRVYYGEYTLKRWIDLILDENVVLPDYQRSFVWGKEKVIKFAESIQENLFIPPITIGHYSASGKRMEIIVDGQQRLTSVLLLWLNLFPKDTKKGKTGEESIIDENDDELLDCEEAIEWTFREIIKSNSGSHDKSVIRDLILLGRNSKINQYGDHVFDELMIDDAFFEEHYIGYSYLVPDDNNANYYYAKTFQRINGNGEKLRYNESRRSLYYLYDELTEFFEPNIKIKIKSGGNNTKQHIVDFVRYLALTFQYSKSSKNIAKGFSKRMEEYYQSFIMFAIDCHCQNNKDEIFDEIKKDQIDRVLFLKKEIEQYFPIIGDSIIDLDIFFAGLVFWEVVEEKSICWDKKENLIKQLTDKSEVYKKEEKHARNPANLEYLNMRVDSSINIYRKYAK